MNRCGMMPIWDGTQTLLVELGTHVFPVTASGGLTSPFTTGEQMIWFSVNWQNYFVVFTKMVADVLATQEVGTSDACVIILVLATGALSFRVECHFCFVIDNGIRDDMTRMIYCLLANTVHGMPWRGHKIGKRGQNCNFIRCRYQWDR